MVATIKSISSSSNSKSYFYFLEKNSEINKCLVSTKGADLISTFGENSSAENSIYNLSAKEFEGMLNGHFTDKEGREVKLGRKEGDELKHHAGQEVIFSAPKSVSIMGLVLEDKRLIAAHEEAVQEVTKYIERNAVFSRVTKDGATVLEQTDNINAAMFTHSTSRPVKGGEEAIVDPQLHSHVLFANLTLCKDNAWRSVVFDAFYENKMHLGELYRVLLAQKVKDIGYSIDTNVDKAGRFSFEINGVSQENINQFSKRREKIIEVAKDTGKFSSEQLANIAKSTRAEKTSLTIEELRTHWLENFHDAQSHKEVMNNANSNSVKTTATQMSPEDIVQRAFNYLSDREAAFSHIDVVDAVIKLGKDNYNLKDIEKAIAGHKEALSSPNGKTIYTTADSLALENATVNLMKAQLGILKPLLSEKEVSKAIQSNNFTLNIGQQNAASLILTTKDRVIGIQGSAGTGKTTVLRAVQSILKEKDYKLFGVAVTKSAANNMRESAGIEVNTVSWLLSKYKGVVKGRGTEQGISDMKKAFANKIVVVDEASLCNMQQIKELLTLSNRLEFRVVLMGDTKQLGAIEAGKPFAILQDHGLDTALISSIQRQQLNNFLKAVYNASASVDKDSVESEKYIKAAIENIGSSNIIDLSKSQTIPSNVNMANAIYDIWQQTNEANEANKTHKETLVITPSNQMRKEVNTLIRKHYTEGEDISHNILEQKDFRKSEIKYATLFEKGDVLYFTKGVGNIKKDNYYEVISKNEINHTLILKNNQNTFEVKTSSLPKENVSVFTKTDIPLAVGERIKFTINSKQDRDILNGTQGAIKAINQSNIQIQLQNGSVKNFDINSKELKHIDHNYATTTYSSQCRTVDNVIFAARGKEEFLKLTTKEALYVGTSRQRQELTLVVDNLEHLAKNIAKKESSKTSSIEHQNKEIYKGELKRYQREVFPNNNNTVKNNTVKNNTVKNNKFSLKFEEFKNSPTLIKETALAVFGHSNERLSKQNDMRFGGKGSISVNLLNGQWFDFEKGEGGSLYSEFKRNNPQYIKQEQSHPAVINKLNKAEFAQNLFTKTKPLQQNSIAASYLAKRGININDIKLSQDVKLSESIYCSEDKKQHNAIVAFARDANNKITAAQTIFLTKDGEKDKSLVVSKRTNGVLKGSFAELTHNTASKTIFVAEGLETALSIASAYPNERVICSFGISNIINLPFDGKNCNKLIVCADNDGSDAGTNITIQKAVEKLNDQGIENIAVVRPHQTNKDFNDILKEEGKEGVKSIIDTVIEKSEIQQLQKQLNELSSPNNLQSFVDNDAAKENFKALLNEYGSQKAIEMIEGNQNIIGKLKGTKLLGISNQARKEALVNVKQDIQTIKDIAKQDELEKKIKTQTNASLKEIASVNIENKTHEEITRAIEAKTKDALYSICGITNYKKIGDITNIIAKDIINIRNRTQAEPNAEEKYKIAERAIYEANQKDKIQNIIGSNKGNITTEDIERFQSIMSNNREASHKEIAEIFHSNNEKIKATAAEYIKRDYSQNKAHWIATQVVKYNERYNLHMPLHQIEHLKTIGSYIEKNNAILLKTGYTEKEASIITHAEANKLALSYNAKFINSAAISKQEAFAAQHASQTRSANAVNNANAISNTNIQTNNSIKQKDIEHVSSLS